MGDPEIVATNHGYACRYTPTIMDGPVFRWAHGKDSQAVVSASRNGVMTHGGGLILHVGPFLAVVQLADRIAHVLNRNDRDTDRAKKMIRDAAALEELTR